MSIPSNKDEFKSYCLRKLGQGATVINVTTEQIDDRVNEALSLFHERHYHAIEEIFILYDITSATPIVDSNNDPVLDSNGNFTYDGTSDVEKGYITLPKDIVSVSDVFRPKNGMGMSSTEYQFYINEVANMINPVGMNNGLSYFYMFDSHMTLVNRFFNPTRTWNFNGMSKKLIIGGGLANLDREYGGIVIRAFRTLSGEADVDLPAAEIHNIWQNRWLQNWATALIMEQWGMNMFKYQEVALLGGVRMNGEAIIQKAEARKVELLAELKSSYSLPPLPFWG